MTPDEALEDLVQTLDRTPLGGWVPPLSVWATMAGRPAAWVHTITTGGWAQARARWKEHKQAYLTARDRKMREAFQQGATLDEAAEIGNVSRSAAVRIKADMGLQTNRRRDWSAALAYLQRVWEEDPTAGVHIQEIAAVTGYPWPTCDTWARRRFTSVRRGRIFRP